MVTGSDWASILASNIAVDSHDVSIVACVIAIIFFMKYDGRTQQSTGHKYIALGLSIGFLLLVIFRIGVGIYMGFYK